MGVKLDQELRLETRGIKVAMDVLGLIGAQFMMASLTGVCVCVCP